MLTNILIDRDDKRTTGADKPTKYGKNSQYLFLIIQQEYVKMYVWTFDRMFYYFQGDKQPNSQRIKKRISGTLWYISVKISLLRIRVDWTENPYLCNKFLHNNSVSSFLHANNMNITCIAEMTPPFWYQKWSAFV